MPGTELLTDAHLFSDAADGSGPWRPRAARGGHDVLRPAAVTGRLDHLNFHPMRKFMETYGQDLGFSPVQVAMRAGHDPSFAAKHCTGNVAEADRVHCWGATRRISSRASAGDDRPPMRPRLC